MKNLIKALLKDESGYGTVELLVLIVGAIVIASTIYEKLITPVQQLHKGAVEGIKGVTGSGM